MDAWIVWPRFMSKSPKTSPPGRSTNSVLVHLGDYVDRGLDSAQVVDWLSGGAPVPVERIVNLMGNHEDMMLQALPGTDKEANSTWLANGGADSLLSWEISRKVPPTEWASLIPAEHQTFLRDLDISFRYGGYMFVHAGIRPGVPLDKQEKQDMLWIREPFLSWKHSLDAVVVHGHTPRHEPEVRLNRIGIDTGAVMGGVLTCARAGRRPDWDSFVVNTLLSDFPP